MVTWIVIVIVVVVVVNSRGLAGKRGKKEESSFRTALEEDEESLRKHWVEPEERGARSQ